MFAIQGRYEEQQTSMENNNEYILSLVASNLSVIPIIEGAKNPHYLCLDKDKKHNLLYACATHDQVKSWIAGGVKSWGVAGGIVSGNLVTLDFDEKHYPGLFDLWYEKLSDDQKKIVDTCYKNKTRNNGVHLRYRTETSQPTIKLARKVEFNTKTQKEEIVVIAETRAEASYALIPPSVGYTTMQGSLLELPIISDEIHEELIDIIRIFNEVEDEPATEYEWKPTDAPIGDRPGDRLNKQATWGEILEPHGWVEEEKNRWRRPGKDKGDGTSATTEYDNRPMLYVFSTSAYPFQANKGYSKFHAFTLLNHDGDFKASAKVAGKMYPKDESNLKKQESQANKLLENILNREDVFLFHDEQSEAHISLEISGHQEVRSCKSKAIRLWLSREIHLTQEKAPGAEVIKSILAVVEGKARFDGPEIELQNRTAWRDGDLWYDLTNKEWQAIKINTDGWEIIDKAPILFKRYSHHKAQIMPTTNGDVNLFLKYINITNPEHRLLFLVFLISCFVPDFPHVVLVVFGAQGSSKSTLSKFTRLVVDPSLIEVASFPHGHKDLIQALAHHYFLFFDNVSYISEEQSDTLCKAVTGGGHTTRELYSDDEDVIRNFRRCIGINGINLVATRPDLLERSLLLELERIETTERKTEKELYENFNKDLPSILGGVFDVLVKSIKIHPTIKLDSHHRMADWALWGCAIAEALGHTKEEFLNAYTNNINRQAEMLLNENIVAVAIFTFMEDKDDWKNTPTELLKQLTSHAMLSEIDVREKYWPKGAGPLTRRLNEISTYLKQMGILIISDTDGTNRSIHIQKIGKTEKEKKEPVQLSLNDNTYDTDDIIPKLGDQS